VNNHCEDKLATALATSDPSRDRVPGFMTRFNQSKVSSKRSVHAHCSLYMPYSYRYSPFQPLGTSEQLTGPLISTLTLTEPDLSSLEPPAYLYLPFFAGLGSRASLLRTALLLFTLVLRFTHQ
jgi:hypothetical protein